VCRTLWVDSMHTGQRLIKSSCRALELSDRSWNVQHTRLVFELCAPRLSAVHAIIALDTANTVVAHTPELSTACSKQRQVCSPRCCLKVKR
jgi:hypothetical protein